MVQEGGEVTGEGLLALTHLEHGSSGLIESATVTRLSRNSSRPVLVVTASCQLKRGPVAHAQCAAQLQRAQIACFFCLLLMTPDGASIEQASHGTAEARPIADGK
jgi:hypothetical protein